MEIGFARREHLACPFTFGGAFGKRKAEPTPAASALIRFARGCFDLIGPAKRVRIGGERGIRVGDFKRQENWKR